MRPPVELPQRAANSCTSCVLANLWYMFGYTPSPDVKAADKALKRKPGGFPEVSLEVACIRRGLAVHHIDPKDPERFIREGVKYQREFYESEWDKCLGRLLDT